MGFTTENRTIKDLFERNIRYIIPRYQRSYVWNVTNWNELLNDIRFTVDNENIHEWSHFLGTIVLNEHTPSSQEKIKGISDYEIIDGQQRLTTIYILLIVLFEKLYNIDPDEQSNSRKAAVFIEETFLISKSTYNDKMRKLLNPDYDLDVVELLDNVRNPKNINDNSFYKLYNHLHNNFKSQSFSQTETFLDKLLSINIVEIVSNQEEEIYNIFEVLNARGQKLKQMELLKNHVLKYVTPREEDYIDNAKQEWHKILKNVSHLNNEDELLEHFSKCYIKRNAENSSMVYRLIKDEISITKIRDLLKDLLLFSEVYKDITHKANTDNNILYFHIKNNKQIRSLLGSIIIIQKKGIIDQNVLYTTIKNIRNFFFIFNATRQTSNKTETIIKNFAYTIYHVETANEFKFEISRLFNTLSALIPKFEKFKSEFANNSSFRYSNKDKNLNKSAKLIKYTLNEVYSPAQHDAFVNMSDLTIEHLLNDDGDTPHASMQNLTITSKEINSDHLKDNDIVTKLSILKEKSNIQANKELSTYYNEKTNIFLSEKRFEDLCHNLYNTSFHFDPLIFSITKEEISKYDDFKKIIHSDKELLNILKTNGKNFEMILSKNPAYSSHKIKFDTLIKENSR